MALLLENGIAKALEQTSKTLKLLRFHDSFRIEGVPPP
jgi:hypothetical protein